MTLRQHFYTVDVTERYTAVSSQCFKENVAICRKQSI